VVGRWGGDELIVVLDSGLAEAKSHIERLQKWVFGEYRVQLGTDAPKVNMDAALGLVEWQPGETMKEVLGRADDSTETLGYYLASLPGLWNGRPQGGGFIS
jgi:PleD family two-component response regulator